MSTVRIPKISIPRRRFLRDGAAAAFLSMPVLRSWGARATGSAGGPAAGRLSLDRAWRFGGRLTPAALQPGFDDSGFERVTLPHSVAPLSWHQWTPAAWQDQWVYRKHFAIPPQFRGLRLFLDFDRVMAAATPVLNGHALAQHVGGFLPFEYEIGNLLQRSEENLLSVAVDAHWLNVPPSGSPKGPADIDYMLPGGISGSVTLRAVPQVFIRDVFARPVNVLDANRRLDVTCQIDSALPSRAPLRIEARLLGSGRIVARASQNLTMEKPNLDVLLTLSDLRRVNLWSTEAPFLYDLVVILWQNDNPLHCFTRRIGFRDARFEVDGFFLNGSRLRIFGLNRHELYPYAGFSSAPRLLRRDAEILRHRFNCNMVRCSHYPQSEAFLDACDQLGLMVWEEVPGWWYVGDQSWQNLLLRDVEGMVRRDRSRPSIVIWGVRVNESANTPSLYQRTREIAKSLDDSRPTSGTMTPWSRKTWKTEWHQDVFAYDDYHSAPDGGVGIDPPLPGVPYLVTETVGQCTYGGSGMHNQYRRAGDPELQQDQALYHAQAHNNAAAYPRCAGALAWCAFDYPSLLNSYEGIKCPGVADIFRLPKIGASFYLCQVHPSVRPVIEPAFYWDLALGTPSGSRARAAIFSNCDRLDVFVGSLRHASLHADRVSFPHLSYPPFFVGFEDPVPTGSELRIEGYVAGARVMSRSFSADRSEDRLWLEADDLALQADGVDTTRLAFGAVDRFGNPRSTMSGAVRLHLDGAGQIIGDNPFSLESAGGLGAVYVRTVAGETGTIRIAAEHPALGTASLEIEVHRSPDELNCAGMNRG